MTDQAYTLHPLVQEMIASVELHPDGIAILSKSSVNRYIELLAKHRKRPRIFVDLVETALRFQKKKQLAVAQIFLMLSGIGLSDARLLKEAGSRGMEIAGDQIKQVRRITGKVASRDVANGLATASSAAGVGMQKRPRR